MKYTQHISWSIDIPLLQYRAVFAIREKSKGKKRGKSWSNILNQYWYIDSIRLTTTLVRFVYEVLCLDLGYTSSITHSFFVSFCIHYLDHCPKSCYRLIPVPMMVYILPVSIYILSTSITFASNSILNISSFLSLVAMDILFKPSWILTWISVKIIYSSIKKVPLSNFALYIHLQK